MALPPSYPGVYIGELPSGQHTITPVATSIAVFVGRAPIGPADAPITTFNFGDYTRFFGGLSFGYPISYAVQDFFANGGSQAIIMRLFEPEADKGEYARYCCALTERNHGVFCGQSTPEFLECRHHAPSVLSKGVQAIRFALNVSLATPNKTVCASIF